MKQIKIAIRINEGSDKIATIIDTEGFRKDNVSDQLELLGIFENLKNQQIEKIKLIGKRDLMRGEDV